MIGFDLTVFIILVLVYGILRSVLFFRKTGNILYVAAASALLVVISSQWIDAYGGRVADLYRTYSLAFNIIPVGILLAYIYLDSERKKQEEAKEKVRGFFGKYVSHNVVEQLLSEEKPHVGGERREVTILYTDVRGFTAMSEKLPAEEVVNLLNEHFNVLTSVAFKHKGTVDKFIGDAVMVIFGAPIKQKDHAMRAVECGIEMQKAVAELNRRLEKKGKHIHIGVSINSGEAIIGNIGSDQFLDYTAIGDTVNTASRMQSAAAAGEVVISPSTLQQVKGGVKVIKKETIRVKGKEKPIAVFKIRV
ncbi:Adenylate and Guanylate cyclase catalytic domain protein [uncultured archaeon]|nr:Adenylate and Guanylate cyclase catalytic domain protein [uncultured archaeon]